MSAPDKKYIRNAEGKFVCPHCDKVTEKQNTMYYHIKKIHDQDLPFECTICPSNPKFLQRSGMLHHMATIHTDVATKADNPYVGVSFVCPEKACGHTTHTKSNMIIHFVRSHCKTWVPAYTKASPCTGCARSFASSSAYLYHCATCFEASAPSDYANMISRIR
jgi:hypothetical protein